MDAWLNIAPEPFLPGAPEHVLSLGIKGRRD